MGGWVGGFHENNATLWLHLASWNLPDSQISWESKMEPSVAKITRHTIGAHGYNLLKMNYLLLSYGTTCFLTIGILCHLLVYYDIQCYLMLFCSSPAFLCYHVLSHASSCNCLISHEDETGRNGTIQDHTGPFVTIQDRTGPNWQYWTIMDHTRP